MPFINFKNFLVGNVPRLSYFAAQLWCIWSTQMVLSPLLCWVWPCIMYIATDNIAKSGTTVFLYSTHNYIHWEFAGYRINNCVNAFTYLYHIRDHPLFHKSKESVLGGGS